MRLLISIFLYGFLLDALLTVANEWLPLAPVQMLVACAVLGIGLVLYVLTAFQPSLPKRLLLPPFLFLVWVDICGAFPLSFVAPGRFYPALIGLQLVLAVALLFLHRRWRRTPPSLEAPRFSWVGFAAIFLLTLLLIPVVTTAASINAVGTYIETSSGGYVKLRPEGLLLEEREMTNGKQRVRLVSMIHIAEKHFYDRILDSMSAQGKAIVLMEGVTDHQGLLKSHFSYAKVAKMFGLDAQEGSSFQRSGKDASNPAKSPAASHPDVEYRRADVDISTFQPLTLEFMNALGVILSDPSVETVLRTVRAPDSPFQKPETETVVFQDILAKRNEHLLTEIDRALETSPTVIVPWGALHLASIEASLKDRGFHETARITRPVIHLWPQKPAPAAP